jgi:endonuclease/exonuclease/phosphatase family metal-dependent hydrolase
MTFNLFEGGAGAGGRRLDLAAAVIRATQPDVLGLCEAHGMAEHPSRFTDLCAAVGMRGRLAAAPSGYHVALLARTPHVVTEFGPVDVRGLNPLGIGSVRVAGHSDFQVAVAHLDYREPSGRMAEARALVALLDPARPRIVLGDLNALSHRDGLARADLLALPLHHVERHVEADGELATGTTRILEEAGLADAWRSANPTASPREGWTVPTEVPEPPHFAPMRIDYIFVSADRARGIVSCRVIRDAPAPRASDHFPVLAELDLDAK